ncbi:solute carrier family 25 member 38 [Sodiomyces alkalinus F11]|uniref:Mitochondrial glycine transporter n=1 Tax=Sodiomyces alkalinus (strain CBS 110278 / VKM F-3762 / F11) TaxID=1314773 RepID=A0A3N2PR96_SODAK|nr:solute carrier family 25 member 38 [Sodiomyces alkalinus F11]ROT37039.1 solute carrier family 25 member 38 [Sodiomyces alkalinus F11]
MAQSGPNKSMSTRHFMAGLGSGLTSAILLQPLDLLKTRVQQANHRNLAFHFKQVASSPGRIWAFWRGTVPSALRTGFGSALYFTSLNTIRQHISQTSHWAGSGSPNTRISAACSSSLPKLSPSANLLAGAVARTCAGFALMPLTVIKVRYESSLYSYCSMLHASRDIYATSGVRGFFSGFGATAVRDAPYAGAYVLIYEFLKKHLSIMAIKGSTCPQDGPHTSLSTTQAGVINFTSGILAGGACSVISNPFDAIKTRIQLEPSSYLNMYQACYKMVSQEGVRSLFDGLVLRMSRKALSSALAWTLYEELMRRAEGALDIRTGTAANP